MMQKVLLIVVLFFTVGGSFSQDIHWSQFNDIPLFQNPGNAGHFNGDYRFVANYRNQWKSVTIPFSTFSTSIDMRKKNFGLGILFFHDQAGDGKFRTVEAQINLAYQFKLTKDSSNLLRLGLNSGLNHRQLNWDKLYFDNQYNGYIFDPSLPTNENYQSNRKSNLNVGLGNQFTHHFNHDVFLGGQRQRHQESREKLA
jgi:type IX secretion system PorP/SprF family membrane protein